MRNEIQVFTNEKFGSVRSTVIDGKLSAVGKKHFMDKAQEIPHEAAEDM